MPPIDILKRLAQLEANLEFLRQQRMLGEAPIPWTREKVDRLLDLMEESVTELKNISAHFPGSTGSPQKGSSRAVAAEVLGEAGDTNNAGPDAGFDLTDVESSATRKHTRSGRAGRGGSERPKSDFSEDEDTNPALRVGVRVAPGGDDKLTGEEDTQPGKRRPKE